MANIALFPGSYKPPHIGHYTAAKQAAKIAGKVKVFVGSGERDSITQDMSVRLWKLYTQNDPNIEIIQSESSPVTDVYDYVELEAKDGDIIYFIKGDKDADDPRFKNIEKYAKKVNKNINKKPINIPDIKSRTGKEMSGRLMRAYIKSEDKRSFIDGLPEGTDGEQAWNIVTGLEELYNKPQSGEQPYGDTTRYHDHWKSNDLGPKKPVEPAYKYKRKNFPFRSMYEDKLIQELYEQGDPLNYTTSTALINNIPVSLETMITPDQQMKGMMGRNSLEGGMLFPYNQVQRRDFHMQNCKISLDIIFIKQGKINNIHSNCPPCKQNNCPNYSGIADNVLEFPGGYCNKNNINIGDEINLTIDKTPSQPSIEINEIKYGSQYLLAQYKDKIQLKHGHQQYRNLQTLMSQQKDEEVEIWLKTKGYMKQENVFTKEWWKNIINEHILTEGGAAGHMAHPFNLPNVNSGKDLKDIFNKSSESLNKNPGSVKIDGVNSSIRLVDLDSKKQFVMDRGSKKPLDIKGITKDDLENRFKPGHGMVKVGGEVLDMFNEALPSLEADLKKLGAWEDPNILFNMEYVSGKTNVQDYGSNFIAIHGLNKIESKEVQGKRGPLIKRASTEVSYDKAALQSMLDNLKPIAEKNDFEVYGSVPTEVKGKPNFGAALNTSYTIKSNKGDKTQSLDKWLNELNNIPEEDFIFMNVNGTKKKVGAVSKQVYVTLLKGDNIDELYESEEDKQKAIEGFTTYLATEKLGDEILKILDSPMGTVDNHEGVVIRDEKIANVPFKITGKFILGGMVSDF